MNTRTARRVLFASLLTIGSLLFFRADGFSQEITYYDFDAAKDSNGSGQCSPSATPTAPNPLFCFNNGGGSGPGFSNQTVLYPAIIDPVQTDNPPAPSFHFDSLLTKPAASQASSMWFSVPQKVSNGFTSYFAFQITPDAAVSSYATADGIAFVIQNAAGGGSETNDFEAPCFETGSGPTAVGGGGGCMGYGGVDNSLAFELDTYQNDWDPKDSFASPYRHSTFNDNHIAIQTCGATSGNSPDHTGSCLVKLNNGMFAAINGQLMNNQVPVTLADGNVHQVVIQYSGPTEATPNLLQIFIDPAFAPGTHTPAPGATPVISGTYNIAQNLTLLNSDSAYVGFTSATGGAFEQHELLAWTFTPHTPVTQQQPLSAPGQQTTFPFGAHTYAVTYPLNGPGTDGIDMVVTANTITPLLFTQLIAGTGFAGSVCQIYDETGGNCVAYSTSCVTHNTGAIVACPAATDSNPITLKSAYNNTVQPPAPGFLKGDPFYSLITSITGDGTTATVTCTGECSVTPGQTITIAGNLNGNAPSAFNNPVTVAAADPNVPNVFTFASSSASTGNGGYVTSNNLQNAFTGYVSQRIDGTTTGRTKNFSDFVVTSITKAATSIVITAPSIAYGNSANVTVALSSAAGTPPGSVSLTVDNGSPQLGSLTNGSAIFSIPGLSAGPHQLVASYLTQDIFQASMQSATLLVTKATSATSASDTPNPSATGAAVVVAVQVGNAVTPGAGVPSGTFAATDGAGDTCNGTLTAGAGSCSLTFGTAGVKTVTVTYSGDANFTSSQTAVQQTVSGPVASVNPSSINFGTLYLGSLSIKNVTLSNVGSSPMTIKEKFLSIVGGGNSNEFIALSLCPSTLNAGKSCTILVTFVAGPTYSQQNATLMINDSAPGSPQSVPLVANVINPQASFSPSSLSFGTQTVGTPSQLPLTVTNSGNTPLTITNLGISGASASDFMPVANTCPVSLAAKASCTITVRFVPGQTGNRNASLIVSDNVWNGSQQVSLSGKGK